MAVSTHIIPLQQEGNVQSRVELEFKSGCWGAVVLRSSPVLEPPSPAARGLPLPLSPGSTQPLALLCHLFNLPLPFPEESFPGTNSFHHSALHFPLKSALATTFMVTNHQLTVSALHCTAHLFSCLQPSATFHSPCPS